MSDPRDPPPLLISVPVPGGFIRVSVSSTFEPTPAETAPEQAQSQPQPAPSASPERDERKATENQVRLIFALMHSIGDDLAKAYMHGHFGTTNPKELHIRSASDLIKWMKAQQPAKKG